MHKSTLFRAPVWGFRSLALLLLLSLTGCLSWFRPAYAQREASFAKHAAKMRFAPESLHSTTVFVLAADDPLADAPMVVSGTSQWESLDFEGRASACSGIATALTSDGYFLTAAHVLRSTQFVVIYEGGSPKFYRAEVVAKESFAPFGCEFALVKVPLQNHPKVVTASPQLGETLFSVGSEVSYNRGYAMRLLGGELTEMKPSESPLGGLRLGVDTPLWQGDSGGPTFNAEGKLVALNTGGGVERKGLGLARTSYLYAPDWAKIFALIERHRAAAAAAPQTATP